MKRVFLFVVMALSVCIANGGQLFYAVDFSSPLNQVGQPPTTGKGPITPSSIDFGPSIFFNPPTVVSSFGQLTNQPLLFRGIGVQQIRFFLSKGVADYFLDFDFESQNLNPSLFVFNMVFDSLNPDDNTQNVETFSLHGLGHIEIPNYSFLQGWTDNEVHHMHIVMNAKDRTWLLQYDSNPPVIGSYARESGPDVDSIRLNMQAWHSRTPDNPNVQIAIDNIRIGTFAEAESPIIACPEPLMLECGEEKQTKVTISVEDSSTNPLQVVWTVNGFPCQTNTLAAATAITPVNLSLTAEFPLGENTVAVSASNGEASPAQCSTIVNVRDTTPPTITYLAATPEKLWPPNGRMVPVTLDVTSEDKCGSTKCRIIGVQCNEPPKGAGKDPGLDWQITGDLTVNLRATRAGNGTGRIYSILVECTDESSNSSRRSVIVTVPENQSAGK